MSYDKIIKNRNSSGKLVFEDASGTEVMSIDNGQMTVSGTTSGVVSKQTYEQIFKTTADQTALGTSIVTDWTKTLVVGRTYRFTIKAWISGGAAKLGQLQFREGASTFADIMGVTATNSQNGNISGTIIHTMTNASFDVRFNGQSVTEPTLKQDPGNGGTYLIIEDITDTHEATTF